ncbi:hypothetical protein C8J57DRAFT_1064453, partial [Mycena rebaudengoi]
PGKCQGVDANMERNIGRVKALFTAKGNYGNWGQLADISAAIKVIDSVKSNIAMSLGASYSGKGHTQPDTSKLVWRIACKARELELGEYDSQRQNNTVTKPSIDILPTGEAVYKSSSIATFNKNRCSALNGEQIDEEADDIPPMDLSVGDENEE